MLQRGRQVKVVDRSEETEEDGTIIQRERERFTNELTLVVEPRVQVSRPDNNGIRQWQHGCSPQ